MNDRSSEIKHLLLRRLRNGKQVLSVNPIESNPLTACLCLPESNALLLGTLQNEVALYQIDCCRLDNVASVHDDNVTALGKQQLIYNLCCLTSCTCNMVGIGKDEKDGNVILASASSDCSVKLWRIHRTCSSSHFRFRPTTDLIAELEHDSSVVSLDFHPYGSTKNLALFKLKLCKLF